MKDLNYIIREHLKGQEEKMKQEYGKRYRVCDRKRTDDNLESMAAYAFAFSIGIIIAMFVTAFLLGCGSTVTEPTKTPGVPMEDECLDHHCMFAATGERFPGVGISLLGPFIQVVHKSDYDLLQFERADVQLSCDETFLSDYYYGFPFGKMVRGVHNLEIAYDSTRRIHAIYIDGEEGQTLVTSGTSGFRGQRQFEPMPAPKEICGKKII